MGRESHSLPSPSSWEDLVAQGKPSQPSGTEDTSSLPQGPGVAVGRQPAVLGLAQTSCGHSFRCLKPISSNKLILAFGINYHIFPFPVCRLNEQLQCFQQNLFCTQIASFFASPQPLSF